RGFGGPSGRGGAARELQQRHSVGARPHEREVVPGPRTPEGESLLERTTALSRAREPGQRLDEEVASAEAARPPAQVRDRLDERGPRGGSVLLLERRTAERAEADPSKRVAVHEVRLLDGREALETQGPRSIEVAE